MASIRGLSVAHNSVYCTLTQPLIGVLGDMSVTEVARLAGVAHSTVSRLINDRGGVSAETSKRIRATMDQLGYRPLPPYRRRGRNADSDSTSYSGTHRMITVSNESTRSFKASFRSRAHRA